MKLKHLAIGLLFFALPHVLFAATFSLSAPERVNVHDSFSAEVFLDTKGDTVNALEGSVLLPKGFSVKEIRYQGSVVSLWLESPQERKSGVVNFAGVLPGGYQASPELKGHGNLFTLVLGAETQGEKTVSFGTDTRAYLNDGEGTGARTSFRSARVAVLESGAPKEPQAPQDVYQPEVFTPVVVAGDPYGIPGKVLVFSTQDKDSGIAHYDVSESYIGFLPKEFLGWHTSESPYSLVNGEENEYLFVRAVDVAGNARIVTLTPGFGVAKVLTWGLPIFALVGLVWFIRTLIMRKRKVFLR